jgi:hypothetical protein
MSTSARRMRVGRLRDERRYELHESVHGHSSLCQFPLLAAGCPPNVYQISPVLGHATFAYTVTSSCSVPRLSIASSARI